MKDIKMKDLIRQWEFVIVNIFTFICVELIKLCKYIYRNVKYFYETTDWVKWHPYIFFVLIMAAFTSFYITNMNQNHVIQYYSDKVFEMELCIDSLQAEHQEDILLMKAGEYHITPHHKTSDMTKDSVASLLTEINAWYPDIIMTQIQFESSYGTSDVARNANNVLGMKKTNKRRTTQIKNTDYNGYGKYINWESCIIDRVLWDYSFFGSKKPTRETYINKLNNFYGGTGNYGNVMDQNSKPYLKYLL